MILWGFAGAHALHMLTDDWETVRESPLSLLALWQGMSSFGGLIGGIVAALAIMCWRGMPRAEWLRYLDCVAFVFPFAWVFGRLGCAIAHDHPGLPTDHWLAVRFPEGTRWDMGLVELLVTSGLAATLLALDRTDRRNGFYLGLVGVAYGGIRLVLDPLRVH
jgi:phosphatidylglycerol:prolipoprotein diacylglycerol transferase